MTATARLMPVLAMFVALVDGNLNLGPASAEDDCLAAPNAPAPRGSHWHYRTDQVRKIKCWYLRPEGQAIQKPTAQEKPETDVATGPAAPTPKTAPDQLGLEPMQLHPAQAVLPAPADQPTARADKVAWPDPPSPARADKVAWPDPRSSVRANEVAWPDPGSPTGVDKAASPDPPLPARSANPDVASQKPPAVATTPQEESRQARETHGNEEMLFITLVAVAAGLMFAGIIMQRIVQMAFARLRSAHPDVARKRMTRTFVAQDRALAPDLANSDLADDTVKEALRKLLQIIEREAA